MSVRALLPTSLYITDVTQKQQFDVIASASAGSGWDEACLPDCLPDRQAILKFGDCFALPHKSPQVLAKTFTILRKVSIRVSNKFKIQDSKI